MLTHKEAKRRGARIVARLRSLGCEISTNHGLQAVAASEDYPDWNRMLSAIEQAHGHGAARGMAFSTPKAKAVASPGRRTLLVAGPGFGKTTMLSLRMAAEVQRGGRYLFIGVECDAGLTVPKSFRREAYRVEIEGSPDGSGGVVHRVSWVPPESGNAEASVLVSVKTTDYFSNPKRGAEILAHCLAQLPELLGAALPMEVRLDGISLVLLDEAHRLMRDAAGERVMREILPRFASGGAEVIAATQLATVQTLCQGDEMVVDRLIVSEDFRHFAYSDAVAARVAIVLEKLADEPPDIDDDALLLDAIAGVVLRSLRARSTMVIGSSQRAELYRKVLDEHVRDREERLRHHRDQGAGVAVPGHSTRLVGFAVQA